MCVSYRRRKASGAAGQSVTCPSDHGFEWERDTLSGATPTRHRELIRRKVDARRPHGALVHRSVVHGEFDLVSDCGVAGKNHRARPRVVHVFT